MNDRDIEQSLIDLAGKRLETEQQINDLVNQLIGRAFECDPLKLLKYCQSLALMTMVNKPSEPQAQSVEGLAAQRAVEYVQSILVAYKNDCRDTGGDPSYIFLEISKLIEQIFQSMPIYYLALGAELQLQDTFDPEQLMDVIEEQLMYSVRGHRYQIMEKEYFRELLFPHNDEIVKLFGMDSATVVEGLVKLQHSLTQGTFDVINQLGDQLDSFSPDDPDFLSNTTRNDLTSIFRQILEYDLNDVCYVTGWPESFVKPLSFKIGEEESFRSIERYAGWPIVDLPIQKRPFIAVNGRYYCFDYYSFVDNFYRAIQKLITRLDPDYNWGAVQKEASETFAAQVFQRLLPGCVIYRNNYYPQNQSLKSHYENDLLILYYDVLIIVEVKAGSFVYTAPLIDYPAHVESYKSLIEKPSTQCKRTYDYLQRDSLICFYLYFCHNYLIFSINN